MNLNVDFKSSTRPTSFSTRSLFEWTAYLRLAGIVATFCFVTLWLTTRLNLYIDELYSLHTTGNGFIYAREQALGFEQQPPLFFLALTAWRMVNKSDFFAHGFSIVCSAITLIAVWSFARRVFPSLPDWFTPFVFAIDPFFIWSALDIRVYAMIIMISALLLVSYIAAFTGPRISKRAAIAFTLFAVAGLYTQYFIGFILAGLGVAQLLCRTRRIFAYFFSMFIVAVAFAPLAITDLSQQFSEASKVVGGISPLVTASRVFSSTLAFAFPRGWTEAIPIQLNIIYVLLVGFILFLIIRERPRSSLLTTIGATFLTVLTLFVIVVLVLSAPIAPPQHIAALFIPTMLLLFAMLAAIVDPVRRWQLCSVYLVVFTILSAANLTNTYQLPISKTGDWKRVGTFLTTHVAPSEPIAVFDSEDELAVRHYYHGAASIVPIARSQPFTIFDRRDYAIATEEQLAASFPHATNRDRRVWLVEGYSTCTLVELNDSCSILESFLRRHFYTMNEHWFNGTNVRELQTR